MRAGGQDAGAGRQAGASGGLVWNLRYGYFTSDDDAAGGFNDYDAHVVSTGVRLSF